MKDLRIKIDDSLWKELLPILGYGELSKIVREALKTYLNNHRSQHFEDPSQMPPPTKPNRKEEDVERGTKTKWTSYMLRNPYYFEGVCGRKFSPQAVKEEALKMERAGYFGGVGLHVELVEEEMPGGDDPLAYQLSEGTIDRMEPSFDEGLYDFDEEECCCRVMRNMRK